LSIWISENWLALYGAVIGTVALIINLSRFFHTLGKDKVKLRVTAEEHPNKSENEIELANPDSKEPGGGQQPFLPVYRINVTNTGSVDAHIENAYVLTNESIEKHVLVTYPNDHCMYGGIEQVGTIIISPKASLKLNIYLKRGEKKFTARKAQVVDGTGKIWKAKI